MSHRPESSPVPPAGRSIPRARRMIIAHVGGDVADVRVSAARDREASRDTSPASSSATASGRPPGKARPRHRGDHHAPVPHESHPRRRTTGRRAGPPVPGGAAGPRGAGPARGLRRSGQAPGPPAVPPDNRLVQQAHEPGGHMPAGSTRLASRHGMKSWRTDDESSRGTALTATRTELNNMSASGAAPFRKHGRKYSAGRACAGVGKAELMIAGVV
jgi:hypothetical protein